MKSDFSKAKKTAIVLLAVLLIFVSSLGVINAVLRVRHWKYVYYGKSKGIECELLYTKPAYKSFIEFLTLRVYSIDSYYSEVWVKLDNSIGGVSGIKVDNYKHYTAIPAGVWTKVGSKCLTLPKSFMESPFHILNISYYCKTCGVENVSIKVENTNNMPFIPKCPAKFCTMGPF